jgi:YesN/AraC family two-component response regulator
MHLVYERTLFFWSVRIDKMARILIIDDSIVIRKMLKQFLEKASYEVLDAPDGKAGLKLHHVKPADLVITDIVMPEKDGLEIIMEFRRDFPAVKIIAVSGGGQVDANEYLHTARLLGAQKTLSKPFELQDLLRAVKELHPLS